MNEKAAYVLGFALLTSVGCSDYFKEDRTYPQDVPKNRGLEVFGEYGRFDSLVAKTLNEGEVIIRLSGKPYQYKLEEELFTIFLQDSNSNKIFDVSETLTISKGGIYNCAKSIHISPTDDGLYYIKNPFGYCFDRNTEKIQPYDDYHTVDDLVDLISKK